MNNSEGLQPLQNSLSGLPQWVSERILHQVSQLTSYEPMIGIMGKTGAGKSSLCNALFAGEVSPVSDVAACIRALPHFSCIHEVLSPGASEEESGNTLI